MSRATPSYLPAAPAAASSTRWGMVAGLTLGVTAIGLVAGAAIAEPDQMAPLARWTGEQIAMRAGPWWDMTRSASLDLIGSIGSRVLSVVREERSPRELAMILVGSAAVVFAVGAVGLRGRASRRAGMGAAHAKASEARDLSLVTAPAARMQTPRRAFTRTTPTEVRALVERGSSLTDIARRTGMPVDAVRTLLAVADPSGQLPVRTA